MQINSQRDVTWHKKEVIKWRSCFNYLNVGWIHIYYIAFTYLGLNSDFSHLTRVKGIVDINICLADWLCLLFYLFNANFRHSVHNEHHTDTIAAAVFTILINLAHVYSDHSSNNNRKKVGILSFHSQLLFFFFLFLFSFNITPNNNIPGLSSFLLLN